MQTFFKFICLATIGFLLQAPVCLATGWNDYELDIGDGYSIFRANSDDVYLVKGNRPLFHQNDFGEVGRIFQYYHGKDYIFTKNYGRKPRNLFKGDTLEESDLSKEFYFIIIKESDNVTGPLSESEFMQHPIVKQMEVIKWKKPRNPNVILPLFGSIIFLFYLITILLVKYFWIFIPLLILVGIITINRRKAKNQLTDSSG